MECYIDYNFFGVVEVSVLRVLFIPEHLYLNETVLISSLKYTYKLRTNIKNLYI